MKIKDFLYKNKDLIINFLVALLTSVSKLQAIEEVEQDK